MLTAPLRVATLFLWFWPLLVPTPLFATEPVQLLRALQSSSFDTRRQALLHLSRHLKELHLRSDWQGTPEGKIALKRLQDWRKSPLVEQLFRCARFTPLRTRSLQCLAYIGGEEIAKRLAERYRRAPLNTLKREGLPLFFLLRHAGTPYLLEWYPRLSSKGKELILRHAIQYPNAKGLPHLKRLLTQPKSPSPALMVKVFRSLGVEGRKALCQWLRSPTLSLSLKSALLLGRMGGTESLKSLTQAYQKASNPLVKKVLLQALAETRLAEEILLRELQSSSTSFELKKVALFGLGFSTGEKGERWLLQQASEQNSPFRLLALQALAMRRSPKALPLFQKALESPQPKLRAKGLYGIVRLRAREFVPKLQHLFQVTKEPAFRWQLLSALAHLANDEDIPFWLTHYSSKWPAPYQQVCADTLQHFSPTSKALTLAQRLSQSPLSEVRHKGWAYLEHHSPSLLFKVLADNLALPHKALQRDSAKQLTLYSLPPSLTLSPQGRQNLLRLVWEDPRPEFLLLLGQLRVEEGEKPLTEMIHRKDEDFERRRHAVLALGYFSTQSSLQTLLSLAREKGKLQPAAFMALGMREEQTVRTFLLQKYQQSEPELKRTLLEAMGRRDAPWRRQFFLRQLLEGGQGHQMAYLYFLKLGKKAKAQAWQLLAQPHPPWRQLGLEILLRWASAEDWKRAEALPESREKEKLLKRLRFYRRGRANWHTQNGQKVLQSLQQRRFSSRLFHLVERRFDVSLEAKRTLSLELARLSPPSPQALLVSFPDFAQAFSLPLEDYPRSLLQSAQIVFHPHGSCILLIPQKDGTFAIGGGIWKREK